MEIRSLETIVRPIVEEEGFFLVELLLEADNRLKVIIDAKTGIGIRDCISVSKRIETHLDRDTEYFELTVSGAGIGYPFKIEAQYEKNIGNKVEVTLCNNLKKNGILKSFDEKNIILVCEKKTTAEGKKKKITLTYEEEIKREDIKVICDLFDFNKK